MENRFLVDSEFLSPQALARKHQLETDPSSRKSHMEYLPGMEQLHSDVRDKVIGQMESYDPARYTARDVRAALDHETCSVEDFKALLSPAAEPFLEEMAARGCTFAVKHCCNSAGTFAWPEFHLDMVRPGLLLYGCGEFAGQLGLRPVMTLKTTVSTIKVYEPGTSVSYGRRFVTDRTTRMGVVPYGYADGFFRCLSDRWQMMTAEGPAPQRGRICMDMCMIDLTDRPSVDVGDEVEIFGPDNSVNDMAEQAGTIPYELTCAVSKRVPRIYLRQGQEIARELLLRF